MKRKHISHEIKHYIIQGKQIFLSVLLSITLVLAGCSSREREAEAVYEQEPSMEYSENDIPLEKGPDPAAFPEEAMNETITERAENAKNIESTKDIKSAEGTEITKDTEDTEITKDPEITKDTESTEAPENAESIADLENTEISAENVETAAAAEGTEEETEEETTEENKLCVGLAKEIYEETNKERIAAGLPALVWSDELAEAADIRAEEIIDCFDHVRPDGTKCYALGDRIHGENLGRGPEEESSGYEFVRHWMESPGHRANILRKEYTLIGVGTRSTEMGYTAVQIFGY